MSSPVVESVRTIPLIVEKGNGQNYIPMEIDASGFPFERDSDRDGHFRSQLDDIAKRHPELAEHLGTFSRRRQSSGGDPEDFHRRFERPFPGRFDRFSGFPFDRDDFDPEQYAQQFYQQQQPDFQQPQPQTYQPQQPGYQQQTSYQPQSGYQQQPSYEQQASYQPQAEYQQQARYQPQAEYQQPQYSQTETADNPSNSESGRNIQQSSTIDLGQKQEPVNERNQRSMSAPPAEKTQRFTSSIKIPVNQPTEAENMAQTQSPDSKTTERIIPIHIEGRDEPVLPKNAPPTYSQPQQQPYSAGPQPERIFGQRPEHFTQFVNREPRQYEKWHRPAGFDQMHQGFSPEELLRQQRFPQQNVPPFYQQQRAAPPQQHVPPQQQPKDEIPIPVQKEVPHTKQQGTPQQQAAPQPQQKPAEPQQKPVEPQQKPVEPQQKPAEPQQPKLKNPIDQIQAIQKDVSALMAQVEQFSGQPKDKQYLYLDEMLTRNLLKLDNIDTQGQDSIRTARKEAIKCIEKTISVLEAKAASNVEAPKEEKMEVEEKSQEQAKEGDETSQTEVQTMETEPTAAAENKAEPSQQEPMEFSPASQEQAASEEVKKDEEKPAETVQPVVENRAVLVTTEQPKTEVSAEAMETKEEPPAVVAEESKSSEELKPAETCEGQESNLAVADAVRKFEGKEGEKEEDKVEGAAEVQEGEKKVEEKTEEQIVEGKKEEKKEKKKGKKKAEKKEK